MKRKTERSVIVIFIMAVMFSFYSICFSWLAGIYTMTDEQYACEAQKIVNCSRPLCNSPTNTMK